jgi:predicted RNA binding protein YcfA (HicA-like mRNA interferase family)
MPKLPRLTAREILAALEKVGFSLVRHSGSHMIYKNAAGKRATIPFHVSKILCLELGCTAMAVSCKMHAG